LSWNIQIVEDTFTPLLGRIAEQIRQVGGHGIEFGATAYYAPFHEFGTSRISAAPFIRPAFDANQQKFQDALAVGVLNGNALAEIDVVGADMVDMARGLARVRTGFMRDSIYYRAI